MGTIITARDHRLSRYLTFTSLSILLWQIIIIVSLFIARSNAEFFTFLTTLAIPFEGFTVLLITIYVVEYFNSKKYWTPLSIAILAVIPVVTFILALTNNRHGMLVTGVNYVTSPGFSVTISTGVWYGINKVYCCLMVAITLTVALVQHKGVPRAFRKPSEWILYSAFALVAGILFAFIDILPIELDYVMIMSSISMGFIFMSTISTAKLDFLNKINSTAINEISRAMFILDADGKLISCNSSAETLLTGSKVRKEDVEKLKDFVNVMDSIFAGAKVVANVEIDADGTDYIHPGFAPEKTYNMRQKSIFDKKGSRIGNIITCSDVTQNRELMKKLENESGLDALTGLFNRYKADELKAVLDCPENLPIAVIVADLNDLKTINDTKGHMQGDLTIRSAAEKLRKSCPPKAVISRIGGDEFQIMIPEYDEQAVMDVLEKVRQKDSSLFDESIHPSIALGYSIKTEHDQDIDEHIKIADKRMYEYKKRMKAGDNINIKSINAAQKIHVVV